MTFKEKVKRDIGKTFLNTGQHAEETEFMGNQVEAVVDYEGTDFTAEDREGVAFEMVALYLDRDKSPAALHPGAAVSFNGETWHVHSSTPEAGMLTVRLYREIPA